MLIEQRNSLRGEISVPGDKSISHRAIMFGSLAKGTTEIDGFLLGEDCLSTIDCLRKMQIGIDILSNNKIKVYGKGLNGFKQPSTILNAGHSGTTIRLLMGALSGQNFTSSVTRAASALKKPLGKVIKPLRKMGVNLTSRPEDLPPITIFPSKSFGITYETSRFDTYVKTPVLIAGLYAEGYTTVIEPVKSRDHTELMLNYFGADIRTDVLSVTCSKTTELYNQHILVPGDISMASYFITAGLLVPNSDITIKNVGVNPTRTGILDVYRLMGAKIEFANKRTVCNEEVADIRVTTSPLNAVTIEETMIPSLIDEIPIIAVAAALAKGTTTIKGLNGFKIKESKRISALAAELSKMGASARETEDGMIIEGAEQLRGTIIDSNNDYSIAMSMSVAGLVAEGETMIRRSHIMDVVFPEFLPTLNKL